MVKPRAIILIGLPASGKSTYSSLIPDEYVRISTDDYIEKIAKSKGSVYSEVFTEYIDDATEYNRILIQDSLHNGADILVDQTNLSSKKRRYLVKQFKENGYFVSYKMFVLPLTDNQKREWSYRLGNRPGKIIPDNILHSMTNNFQLPVCDEGYDDIEFINTFGEDKT